MITALGGGVGAAKFLTGLEKVCSPSGLNVIVNTADDINIYGFRVSPDIDTVIYRLSGQIDKKKGWGLDGDTFSFLASLKNLGMDPWFNIGDRDLITHIFKNSLRQKGHELSEITRIMAEKYGLEHINLLPMTDENVETWIDTASGKMHFQEYYIKQQMEPEVLGVEIRGAENAVPAPGVLEAIENADVVFICPSNPIISIGPILEIKGIRERLVSSNAVKVAISPLIGGKPLKGPTDRLMKGLGLEVSSTQIAKLYSDFLDIIVIDSSDDKESDEIRALGIEPFATDILISDDVKSEELANRIIGLIR